jgi:heat-inducible transcriptional repressor
MRIDYKKIIPYIEYLTGKISDRMSGDDENTFAGTDINISPDS